MFCVNKVFVGRLAFASTMWIKLFSRLLLMWWTCPCIQWLTWRNCFCYSPLSARGRRRGGESGAGQHPVRLRLRCPPLRDGSRGMCPQIGEWYVFFFVYCFLSTFQLMIVCRELQRENTDHRASNADQPTRVYRGLYITTKISQEETRIILERVSLIFSHNCFSIFSRVAIK